MGGRNFRYIALDFETTGLDLQTDEPIQIWIMEFDLNGRVLWGFQSLLRPAKKATELKSIVWFITKLSIQQLESAPRPEEIIEEIQWFFWEDTIIVGHNISFDLHFLEKFFPWLKRKTTLDTFKLSQTLIHYPASYAQEVLIQQLKSKQSYQKLSAQLKIDEEEHFHDAFYDAKLSASLFLYLIDRIRTLISTYPVLGVFLWESESFLKEIFDIKESKSQGEIDLPPLKKITPPHTQMLSGTYNIDLEQYDNYKRYRVWDIPFKELLSSLACHKHSIFAFSNKSKLDIAKNLLNDLGIKNLWFVKEEQTLSRSALKKFANKGSFTGAEISFLLKYFSHLEQGLGILDLNSKEDYEIYTALKDTRQEVDYPIILATHAGLFSILEQQEKYEEYQIFFFDSEWRYKSFNLYLSRPYDLNYTLNYLEMLEYKYRLITSYGEIEEKKLTQLIEFKQFFTVFIGILGQETKKFFTHTEATQLTLEPIKGNVAFYQTNKLLEKFADYEPQLREIITQQEFSSVWNQIEHMIKIFDGNLQVEKKMYDRSAFYFIYSEEVKFSSWDEFLELFRERKALFLSHTDTTLPCLISEREDSKINKEQQKGENQIFHLSKTASVLKAIEAFDKIQFPNGAIFILSVKKEESKELFEALIKKGMDQDFLPLVENITGGSWKNLFKAKQQGTKIIIWGYAFLLQLFAQKIAISKLIIYNNKGKQQDLIFSDILRYGKENLA